MDANMAEFAKKLEELVEYGKSKNKRSCDVHPEISRSLQLLPSPSELASPSEEDLSHLWDTDSEAQLS